MKVKKGANIWIAFVSAPGYYVNFMHQILANWEIWSFHPGKSTNVFVGRKLHCVEVTFELEVRTKTKVFLVILTQTWEELLVAVCLGHL